MEKPLTPSGASPRQPFYSAFLTKDFAWQAAVWTFGVVNTVICGTAKILARCIYWYLRIVLVLTAAVFGIRR